ncbi:hypothetical protein LDO48_21015 [Pantoea agglomerans]|nr:hypothetical protein [Pantoea agglomerans]
MPLEIKRRFTYSRHATASANKGAEAEPALNALNAIRSNNKGHNQSQIKYSFLKTDYFCWQNKKVPFFARVRASAQLTFTDFNDVLSGKSE